MRSVPAIVLVAVLLRKIRMSDWYNTSSSNSNRNSNSNSHSNSNYNSNMSNTNTNNNIPTNEYECRIGIIDQFRMSDWYNTYCTHFLRPVHAQRNHSCASPNTRLVERLSGASDWRGDVGERHSRVSPLLTIQYYVFLTRRAILGISYVATRGFTNQTINILSN